LVVDDREIDRKLLSTILKSAGYKVAEAINGIAALDYVKKSKPDMIISDIMMPEMDGFTFLRELKKSKHLKDIPFLFYTAHYVSKKDNELAASLGASRFMIKPKEPQNLLYEIETVFKDYKIGVVAPVDSLIKTEEEYLKRYSERIFVKLEEKVSELEKTKQFLDTVLDDMGDGVIVTDADLNTIYCNKRMHNILECDTPSGSISPDVCHSPCIVDIAHASHKPFEIEQITKKDNIVHLEGIVSPVKNENNDVILHIGVFRDATERNKVQEEIERKDNEISRLYDLNNLFSSCSSSDELIKCALEQIVDIMELEGGVVCLINKNKIEIKWSVGLPPKFVELLRQQSLDSPAMQKVLDPDHPVIILPLSAHIPGMTESEQVNVEESIITLQLRANGSLIGIADLMVSPYRNLSDNEVLLLEKFGKQLSVTIKNFNKYDELKQIVMEYKQLGVESLDKSDHSIEQNMLCSTFLSSVGHELRTPLNSILGFTSLVLQGKTGEISDMQQEQLAIVYDSAQDQLDLINDVMDISKIEAGIIEFVPETFLLDDAINEVISNLEGAIMEKGLQYKLDIPPGIKVFQDKQKFTQVLTNLVSNSIKFTNSGTIEITGSNPGNEIQVSVKDPGIGIKEEDIPILFEPFARINPEQNLRGTSLGLYLCEKVVNLMQGRIFAESEFGKGSVFTFNIPIEYKEVESK